MSILDLYNWLRENDITIWIDGGWGVDALLGTVTREHGDLDIAVHRKDNAKLRKLLVDGGYKEEARRDSSEFMYVLSNEAEQPIDIHVFEYDESGKNIYGVEYPYGSLTGKGIIDGQEVNCISPEWMFRFKTSYAPTEKDIRDVRALSEKFGFDLPDEYK
jgi:lincosamide nucleotidyltransferase A/C/D/E